jgi:hypothetical protein
MEEIPEDTKRDAIIDAMMSELEEYVIVMCREGHCTMSEVFQNCIKDRLIELFEHAVGKALQHDR